MITIIVNFSFTENVCSDYYHEGVVDNVYSSSITITEGGNKYYIMKIDQVLVKGDIITFNAKYYQNNSKGGFDLFYKQTEAIAYGYASKVEISSHPSNLRTGIFDSLIKHNGPFSEMTLLMIYGIKNDNTENIYANIANMGIAHLFVTSGFHISLFFLAINKLGKKITNNSNLLTIISFFIVSIFLYLIYFPPTGVRAILTLILIKTKKFKKIEALSIIAILFFISNPWIMVSNSMILSFGITGMIYLYKPSSNKLLDALCLSICAFFVSLPTILTWNTTFNLFAPFLNVLLSPIVSIMYIISLIFIPFHKLWFILDYVFLLFEIILNLFSNLTILVEVNSTTMIQQLYLTIMTITFITFIKDRIILLNTFATLSFLFFII